MTLVSLYRAIVFAWQGFWRNFWLSLATISIIVLTIISINVLVVINVVTEAAITIVKERVDVSFYFYPDVTESQVLEVQTFLSSLPEVKEITYVSQQEALDQFRREHQADQVIIESLEELDENPIGSTLLVKTKTIEEYDSVISELNASRYNDLVANQDFEDHNFLISQIKNIADNAQRVALCITMTFVVIALLIVFNTIRVAIYTHRQEIAVMKLVGATNWFIRAPFLLEGVFYGVFASIIAALVVYPLLQFVQPYVADFFNTDSFNVVGYFTENFWQIFGLELLVVILLDIISSSIAIRRYLAV